MGLLCNSALGVVVGIAFGTLYINFALSGKKGKVIAVFIVWAVLQAAMAWLAFWAQTALYM